MPAVEHRRALRQLHARRRAGVVEHSHRGRPRGKVVSTGSPGSGTEVIALRVIAAGGLDPGARSHASRPGCFRVGRCTEGRQDRRVLLERRFADRGNPGPRRTRRASRSGWFPTATCCRRSGAITATLYFPLTLPAGAYPGLDARRARRRRGERPGRERVDARAIWPTTSRALLFEQQPRARGDSSRGAATCRSQTAVEGIARAVPSRRDPLLSADRAR